MALRIISLLVFTTSLANAQGALRFELKRIVQKTQHCVITFEYPEVISAASPEARDRINAGVLRVLLRNTSQGADSGFRSLDAYAGKFMQSCAEFQNRPEARQLYEHKRVTIFRYTPPVLSFRMEAEEDGGGVHPFGNIFFANFDSSTGKDITIANLVREGALKNVESLAEATFRREHGFSPRESLAEKSYNFPGDRFRLNDNFGIGEKQIVFLFNTYEIGPGAMGQTKIELPYNYDLLKLLKIDLRQW